MKITMIFPDRESERAISGYSINLVKALKQNNLDVTSTTYKAHSPKTLFDQLFKISKYDIIHLQHEYNLLGKKGLPFFYLLAYLKLFKKGKLIVTMHNILSLKEKFNENRFKTLLRKILYFTQNRFIKWAADRIFVHSDFFVPVIQEYGIPKKQVVVLPQGIITNVKITPQNKAKKGFKLSGNTYLIMGNLTRDSGADIIVNQADKISGTVLIVANPYPVNPTSREKAVSDYLKFLKEIAEKKELKNVRFDLIDINDKKPEWWKYLSAADFLLLAYRGAIGSGMFAHAMSTKTPVITSNIPFFRDISKKYKCLEIAKTEGDFPRAIMTSLKPKNYKKMKKECSRYLKENNWASIAKKYKEIYLNL